MNWLQKDKIKLRALELSDIDVLYDLENDSSLWTLSNTLAPFSKYILKKYLEASVKDIYEAKELRLMIDFDDTGITLPIGIIDIFDFDPFHKRAGLGIVINAKFRRQNHAFNALVLVIDYCFNYLNLHQLYCNISEDNIASIKLFQKLDFNITASKKDWLLTKNGFKNELFLQLIKK
jgi:diamine N-acetyltransferase